MNGETESGLLVRRILVALDVSPASLAALQAAAELASHFDAELAGLYVEDINLIRLAGLPFSREVGAYSAARRTLHTAEIERQLRLRAAQARRALARVAGRSHLRWQFKVVRGSIATELMKEAHDADLVILGHHGWSPGRPRLGSTARTFIYESPTLTLVLHEQSRRQQPLLLVYDGSDVAVKALAIAATLARGQGRRLTVLLANGSMEIVHERAAQVQAWEDSGALPVATQLVSLGNLANLARTIYDLGDGMLVLPGSQDLLANVSVRAFLEETARPVLLVR